MRGPSGINLSPRASALDKDSSRSIFNSLPLLRWRSEEPKHPEQMHVIPEDTVYTGIEKHTTAVCINILTRDDGVEDLMWHPKSRVVGEDAGAVFRVRNMFLEKQRHQLWN